MVLPASDDGMDVEVDIMSFVVHLGVALLLDNQADVADDDFMVAFVRFAAVVCCGRDKEIHAG